MGLTFGKLVFEETHLLHLPTATWKGKIWKQGDEAGRSLCQYCPYKLLRVWREGEMGRAKYAGR